ncbi:hypothetical protein [Umezawaea tangerina]|uniref:Uncharacterized protein n=1 Tax=Umezawaea tangerina TaxID=84725 RepID=A0A2T0T249_9PSEU|nr:hypothetical protein [Umezawaea tangerina]PRY39748.1 hypothetical protein CLV43_107335 [Umezawaea tangerina]
MATRTASAAAILGAVITATVMCTAPNANADLVTYCVGGGGAVTVPNDLYVPAGESCSLRGTVITGNVRVAAGANLVVDGGTVNGSVGVAANGYLDATDTRIDGDVTLAAGGFGVYLKNTDTSGVVLQPRGSATIDGFLYAERGSKVDGTVTAGVGEVSVSDSEVTGNVSTNGAYLTDLHGTFVDGTLSVLNNATGSVVCGSAVQGRSTFAGNVGGVQLGPNGGLDSCASGGYFARDVGISNTTGGRTTLDDNVINGSLALTANNPVAEVADNNRIRNGVVGERTTPTAAKAATEGPRGTARQRAHDRLALVDASVAVKGKARL